MLKLLFYCFNGTGRCKVPFYVGDIISPELDLTLDPTTGERRDRDTVRALLHMWQCPPLRYTNHQADLIRK